MPDDRPTSIRGLLARLDHSWASLQAAIAAAEAQGEIDEPRAGSWSAKQCAAHVAAWERSLMALLRGEQRAAAMGIPEGDEEHATDDLNRAIALQAALLPAAAVLQASTETHAALRSLLAGLSVEDLDRPYSDFQPDDPPFNATPVIDWIAGNTWQHYDEHALALGTPPRGQDSGH